MAKYTIEHQSDDIVIYRLEFLGEHFRTDREICEENTAAEPLLFDEMVAEVFPKIDADILNMLTSFSTATSESDAAEVITDLSLYEKYHQHNKNTPISVFKAGKEYPARFVCHPTPTGPVLTGELKAADGVHSIPYGGRTLADAMDSFRRAVDEFIAFGYVA